MKILLAPDKFKGSLTAFEVCEAIQKGLMKNRPGLATRFHPMADGGDGSLDILSAHLDLEKQEAETVDPLGRELRAAFFTAGENAFIELASASGLVLLSEDERNPMLTSTLGTGQLMANALEKGCRQLFLFLGGSATNDGGMGMAHALGFRFLDENRNVLFPAGENLSKVHHISSSLFYDFDEIKMTLLCDVQNPLFGPDGAAHVYARQKGASASQIEKLDEGLRHFSEILFENTGKKVAHLPGIGAAGGTGAGMAALFGAELRPGFEAISELTGLEEKIKWADLVISGEGRLDAQSLEGKVVDGVARLCRKYGKALTLFVGKNELGKDGMNALAARGIFEISKVAESAGDAMANGGAYLEKMAERLEF